MKQSEWLELIHSHGVYGHAKLAREYKEKTGFDAKWPAHTAGETNTSLGQFKGVTKEISPENESLHVAYGWEIAETINEEHGGKQHLRFNGRGSRYDAVIRELKSGGF